MSKSMLKRFVCSIILLMAFVAGFAQQLTGFEYWLDDDYASRTSESTSQEDILTQINVGSLSTGVHFFNFRATNSVGEKCSPYRYLFYISGPVRPDATLSKYEYWLDDDYAGRTTGTASSDNTFAVDVSALTTGVHFYNFRVQDSYGEYSQAYRYLFYISDPVRPDAKLSKYEYWLDDEYAGRTTGTASSDNTFAVDVSALTTGVHFYNFRVQDSYGEYSQPYRYLFYIADSARPDATLSKYEYWLDDDYAGRTTGTASSDNTFAVDVSALTTGVHFYNFRVQDSYGEYSQAYRYLFYIPDDYATEALSDIVGYSYSFNNKAKFVAIDKTSSFVMTNVAIAVPEIKEFAMIGDNCSFSFEAGKVLMSRNTEVCFMLRFVNEGGAWSTPVTHTFSENDTIEKPAQELQIQKSVLMDKVPSGDYQAIRFTIPESGKYYMRSTQLCNLDIYSESGTRVARVSATSLKNTFAMQLSAGNFYGIIYDTVTDAENADTQVGIRLMTTNNYVPTPQISFMDGEVTITCAQDDAVIYYTLDGSNPTEESLRYTAPFTLDHNAVVKAIAKAPEYADSFVETLKVDSYKVSDPVIEFANLSLYFTCATEGASIYYTLDGSDPVTYGVLYTKPVAISNSCTVKVVAKRDGYNDSEVVTYELDITNVKCIKPVLSIDGNLLTMTTLTEGATIYYTTNGSTPNVQSERYVSPIVLSHNATYKAIAIKSGEISSDIAEIAVDWFQAELPEMVFADGKLTITCSTPGAVIHYAIGGDTPTQSSPRYTQPIVLTDNRMVKAFAVADGFNPSDIVTYTPDMFTCTSPEISFDGHAITIGCETDGARIYYTINGANPTEQSTRYVGTTVLDGLCTVKAIAVKDEMNNSNVVTYTLPCYYNGGDVFIHTAGFMERAFEWCGLPNSNKLAVNGPMNDADFATLHKLTSLEYLNLSAVTVSNIASEALADMNLIYVSMPSSQFTCGSRILKGCKRIAAIDWNSLAKIPDDILDDMDLPNMLLFVRSAGTVSTKFSNVVINSVADMIELSDAEGSNFYCPREFTARTISYKHTYSQKTMKGVCTGWESIALPFSPTSIMHSVNGAMAPFAANDSYKKPFWLCGLTESGFISADKIEANTPYIIAMPNSDIYSDEYILAGEVMFTGNNVSVHSSETLNYGSKGNNIFTPNFINRTKNTCMTLNVGDEYAGHLPGSLFAHDYRDAKPFEAYIAIPDMMYAKRLFYIDDEITGIEDIIPEENSIHIALVGTTIVIDGLSQMGFAELYDTSGRMLVAVKGNGGKTTIDCSAYKNQTLIVRAINNKEIKTRKFNF